MHRQTSLSLLILSSASIQHDLKSHQPCRSTKTATGLEASSSLTARRSPETAAKCSGPKCSPSGSLRIEPLIELTSASDPLSNPLSDGVMDRGRDRGSQLQTIGWLPTAPGPCTTTRLCRPCGHTAVMIVMPASVFLRAFRRLGGDPKRISGEGESLSELEPPVPSRPPRWKEKSLGTFLLPPRCCIGLGTRSKSSISRVATGRGSPMVRYGTHALSRTTLLLLLQML